MEPKHWTRSRTMWFGMIVFLAAVVSMLAENAGWRDVLLAVVGLGILVLRSATTDPIDSGGS